MYSIKFVQQLKQGVEDFECNSIFLTEDNYKKLPIINDEDSQEILNGNCTFEKKNFFEQVRRAKKSFPAIWISNEDWKLEQTNYYDKYVNDKIHWVFVCIDEKLGRWIAFKFYNLLTISDACDAIIHVSLPDHGELYRLNNDCMKLVKKYYD